MERPQPINNPALKEAIAQAKKDPGVENTVKLLNEVVSAKLLIPVSMDRKPEYDKQTEEIILEKDTQISFELIKSSEGALYYPVFTDGVEMSKCELDKDQHSLIVNFDDLSALLLQPQNAVAGFVINPMSDNVNFPVDMVAAMKDDMEAEMKANNEGDK